MLSRFTHRRDAGLFVGLVLIVTGLGLVAVLGSLSQVGRTFPGFVVWDDLIVVALGRSHWTGIEAGVPFRAQLAAVDDLPVTDRGQVLAAIRATPAGTAHRYRFVTPDGETTRTVRTMAFTIWDWVATMGVYVWNGVAFLIAGLAVLYLKPDSRQSRGLLAFAVIWGLWLLLAVDLFTAGRLQRLYFVFEAMVPAAALHFGLVFPVARWPLTRSSRALLPIYGVAIAVGLLQSHLFWTSYRELLALNNAVYLTIAAVALASLVLIGRDVRQGPTPVARRRARIVLAGAVAAFLLPTLALLAFVLLEQPVSFSLLTLTGFLFPASIGYAIARHDLFEADRFVKLSMAYALITAVVSLLYGLVVFAGDRLAVGFAITHNPLFPLVFTLVALATVAPLRERVQGAVDRLFYRGRVDYKATVARATEGLSALLDRDAIVSQVVEVLRTQVFVEADVWQIDGALLVHRGGSRGWGGPHRLPVTTPGFEGFRRRHRLLSRDEVQESADLRHERPELLALYDLLDANLMVPLLRSGELTGFLAVGHKAAGGPLSADDIDVLRTLASAMAVALANASAVAQLQAAQEQLSTAERLAAIGELAAAVAHGLRNPLAGIKLTAQVGARQPGANPAIKEHFGEVVSEVDKIEVQVRGILDFARPFEPQLQPTDVPSLLQPVLDTVLPQMAERHIVVDVAVPPGLPPLLADRVHLTQVLHELLANARDAMPDGGTITITAEPENARGERVRLAVGDTGPGIPPELRDRVFKLFATTKPHGTGVGLAVVRKIIERHGGAIGVESVEPHGTRFAMLLPTAAVPLG